MTVQPINVATTCPQCGAKMVRYPGYISMFLDAKHRFSSLEETTFLNCKHCQPELEYEEE